MRVAGPGPLALFIFGSVLGWGQAANGKVEFDAATVKPPAPGSRDGGRVRTLAGGQTFTASNVPLKYLIVTAYGLRPDQVSGGPGWVNSDGYDIEGKANRPASRDELMRMLQSLLAERFKLVLRDEKKEQPIYTLVFEKAGAAFKQNKDGGEPLFYTVGLGHYIGSNVSMPHLAWALGLSAAVGRVVLDKTGLTGGYDLDLKFTPELSGPPQDAGAIDSGPSLFTAIREQLGLKLESGKAFVDFYTIEHAERPSGN
jgi:uncharacterized protein (TIGR03435 family)